MAAYKNILNKLLSSFPVWYRVILLSLLTAFGLGIIYLNHSIEQTVLSNYGSAIEREIEGRRQIFDGEMLLNTRNLKLMYSTPPIQGIARATRSQGVDPYDGTTLDEWYARLQAIFVGLLNNQPSIQQIRLLREEGEGLELVRVERDGAGVKVVSEKFLQKKGSRLYYQEAKKLSPGEVYVSPIEYNREYGKLVFPYEPVYRLAMKVYDDSANFFGILVVNIEAQTFFNQLSQGLPDGAKLFLLNDKNQFLIHPAEQYSFDFELGDSTEWSNLYEEILIDGKPRNGLRAARSKQTGELLYYQSKTVHISSLDEGLWVRIVIGLPESVIDQTIAELLQTSTYVMFGIFLLLLGAITVYHYQLSIKQKLLDAQSRFKAIFDGSGDAVIVLDDSGTIRSWNPAATRILGHVEAAAIGKNFRDLMKVPDTVSKALVERRSSGFEYDLLETSVVAQSGKELEVAISISTVLNTTAGTTEAALLLRDVTEQKALEKRVQQVNESLEFQVKERTQELEHARNDAVHANLLKGQFLANMSHEIRTPMNGIFGMLNLLRTEPLNDQQKHYLAMAENSVTALTSLINDILDFSKIEAGRLDLAPVNFRLDKFLHFTSASMAVLAHQKKLEYVVDLTGVKHAQVRADNNRLRQILVNLLSNAIKFTEKGKIVVTASTRQESEAILLDCSVEDTGVGIGKETQNRLFQVFEQESAVSESQYGGTGLGLAISRQLCNLMGGEITVESAKGEGSTFRFIVRLGGGEQVTLPFIDLSDFYLVAIDPDVTSDTVLREIFTLWHGQPEPRQDVYDKAWIEVVSRQSSVVVIDCRRFADIETQVYEVLKKNTEVYVLVAKHYEINSPMFVSTDIDRITVIDKPITPVNLYQALAKILPKELCHFEESETQDHSVSLSGIKVLVVDDHLINQEVTSNILESYGAEVEVADNGRSAIEALVKYPYFDMVLMDCQMPVMDGYEATRKIRQSVAGRNYSHLPIVALTAGAMSDDREKCQQAGMNDYVTKPISAEELFEKVIYWSGKGRAGSIRDVDSDVSLEDERAQWDKDEALKRINNKEELLKKIIRIYLETTESTMDELKHSMDTESYATAKRLAHQMKGISNNVGLVKVALTSGDIEEACRLEDSSRFQALWSTLADQYSLAMDLLKRYLETQ